jgi:hypothetical protein
MMLINSYSRVLFAAAALLSLSANAQAAPANAKTISGKIPFGYTLAVVGYNGKSVLSRQRSFRVRAPDKKVTLQLISRRGRYAGPVVFGGSAAKTITGIKAGTNVGAISVMASKGYARPARRVAAKNLDKGRWAYARRGVPIGNGRNLGLVVSRTRGTIAGAGKDPAHIGIPNAFNIAVPGTHRLKSLAPVARSKSGAAAKAAASPPPDPNMLPDPNSPPEDPKGPGGPSNISPWMSQLFLGMDETLNVDAAGVTREQIDATLRAKLNLKLLNVPKGDLVELNCNGLTWCSRGGTGQAGMQGLMPGANGTLVPFPSGMLDPATGFGELVGPQAPAGLLGESNGGRELSFYPRATSSQIGSGDVVTEIVTDNGVTTQLPATIGFVFNTVPAITLYSDSAGFSNSISYPDASLLGSPRNPLPASPGHNGDVVLHLTILRPQRLGVPGAGEPAFMDIGNLGYTVNYVPSAGGTVPPPPPPTPAARAAGNGGPGCSTKSYSHPSSSLTLKEGGTGGFGPTPGQGWMVDSANDKPANPNNAVSFSIDLSACMRSKGTAAWDVGQTVNFDLSVNSQSSPDHANQTFSVERMG